MAVFAPQQCEISVPARAMLLDTCVLFAAYCPADSHHGDAKDFFFQDEPFLIPYIVVGEAWGLLASRTKKLDCGLSMVDSLRERPNIQFVPVWSDLFPVSRDICQKHRIDLVDAFLMSMSCLCARALRLKKPIPIATYDTRDFTRCYNAIPFGCFDLTEHCLL